MLQINTESPHLIKFRNCYPAPPQFAQDDPAEGKPPRQWYAAGPNGKPPVNEDDLPDAMNRAQLIAMASDVTVETLPLCIAILAWYLPADELRESRQQLQAFWNKQKSNWE
ncbi:MAG: hypothetical protein EON56_01485 [Alphaproteobacteria bacterium]|nr:MAG: hypothetical protein EON56_01485 [Alphaproteobacteria bacterium]